MPEAQALIGAFYDAYNRHDWAAAVALYAPEAGHFEAAMDKSRTGHAALEAGLRGFAGMLPDVRWTEVERIRSGAHVLVRHVMTGTYMPRADVADRSPRHVSLPGVHHFTLADGQIAATADFWDKDAFLAQIR